MKKEEKKIMYVSPEIRTDNVKVEHGFAVKVEHGFAFSTQYLEEDQTDVVW